MAVFAYQVLDGRQRTQSGTISADNPALARHALRQSGFVVTRLTAATTGRRRFWRRHATGATAWAEVWRELALLLRTGIPLADGLSVLVRQHHGALQIQLRGILEAVRSGRSLSEALSDRPESFDPVVLGVVRVGQAAGALDSALECLADFSARRAHLRERLTSVLIYPCILCAVGLGVVAFLMTYVVPQLVDVLQAAGRDLPRSTRLLKAISDALLGGWPWVLVGAGGSILLLVWALRHPTSRRALERGLLRIPVLGDLVRKAWMAHVSLLLALLLRANVRFVEAVGIIRTGARARLLADELLRLETAVEAGSDLAAPLAGSAVFPPLVAQVLAVGQDAGELPTMLEQLREGYDRAVTVATSRFLAVLEPTLVVTLAAVVGFVLYAALVPMLEATRAIQ